VRCVCVVWAVFVGSGTLETFGMCQWQRLYSVFLILDNPKLHFLQRAHYVCIAYSSYIYMFSALSFNVT